MRLYFIRHAESEANTAGVFSNRPPGLALTELGRQQARELAEQLREEKLTGIYTSPLLRAIQTAEPLAEMIGRPYEVADALREYDTGIYEGSKDRAGWEANHNLFMAWTIQKRWQERIEGGESYVDIYKRLTPFVRGLVDAHGHDDDARIALIGHGGLYLALLPDMLKNVRYRWALGHALGNTDVVVAESAPEGLICLSWAGQVPETP